MNEFASIWPWIGLCLSVAIVALVCALGARVFRPTCNRCPICERITGTPASLTPDGDPYVCGHEICEDCRAECGRVFDGE
jgi:hypothetical protein